MTEMLVIDLRNGMTDSAKIIHKSKILQTQTLRQQGRLDDPRVVGHLEHVTLNGACNGNAGVGWQTIAPNSACESSPGESKTCVFGTFKSDRIAKIHDPSVFDSRNSETRVRSADISSDDFLHRRTPSN